MKRIQRALVCLLLHFLNTHIRTNSYVENLLTYLKSFLKKAYPLTDLDLLLEKANEEFEDKWSKGEVEGWTANETDGIQEAGIWCDACGFFQSFTLRYWDTKTFRL